MGYTGRSGRFGLFTLVGVLAVFAVSVDARPLSPLEERGKTIYSTGKSPSGKAITAWFGKDLLEVPGTSATCASCHGYDGNGRTESGITATPVTWNYLMKSYGHRHGDGLEHGAFDPDSLRSYLRDGVYPGEVRGNPAMPVYDIDEEDLDALLSYLRRLGSDVDPGLTSRAVRVGVVSPSTSAGRAAGAVMRETVGAYFREVNLRGGIYGRKIEVVPVEGDVEPSGEAALRLAQEKDVFAFVAGGAAVVAGDLPPAGDRVPWVGPVGPRDEETGLPGSVFYLNSSSAAEAGALAAAAGDRITVKNSAVVVVSGRLTDVAERQVERLRHEGWKSVAVVPWKGLPTGGSAAGEPPPDALFVLADPVEAAAVVRAVAAFAPESPLFVHGLKSEEAPTLFGKLFFSSPLPLFWKDAGAAGAAAAKKYGMESVNAPSAISSLAAAMVLAEGLKSAGRELNRERLVLSLERLYRFETGVIPPVTFGKNTRSGMTGAYIYETGGGESRSLGWYPGE